MKYSYVDDGRYFQGLPAADLDDANLDDGQKALLETAVRAGIYVQVQPVGQKKGRSVTDVQPTEASAEKPLEKDA